MFGGNRRIAWYAAWALLAVLGAVPTFLRDPNSDVAWQLYVARGLLAGQEQGVDFFEVNPPLSIWVMTPAAGFADALGLGAWHLWILTVLIGSGLSLWLLHRLLALISSVRYHFLLTCGLAILVLPRLDFSQREHLALIATLPYTVLAAVRLSGTAVSPRLARWVGLLGAAGFALKPHFLLPWALLEGWQLSRLGWRSLRRPELICLVCFAVLYVVTVLALVPNYLSMALRLSPIYSVYLDNGVLGAMKMGGLSLLVLAGSAFALRRTAPWDPLAGALALAFAGFLASAYFQGKGFSYHYVAAWGYGLILMAHGWAVRRGKLSWLPSGILVRVGVVLLVAKSTIALADNSREIVHPDAERYNFDRGYDRLLSHVRGVAAGRSIAVFSSNPGSAWPLTLEAGTAWSFRYMSLWPLAGLYDTQVWAGTPSLVRAVPYQKRQGFERRFSDEVMEDLLKVRPYLLLVLSPDPESRGSGGAPRIDYLAYFGSDPRFAQFLAHYTQLPSIDRYSLWIRRGLADQVP